MQSLRDLTNLLHIVVIIDPLMRIVPVKNNEKTTSLIQPPVGGVPHRHWKTREEARVEQWIVYVLHFSYHIPFHHLLPVTWEPREILQLVSP